MSEALMKAALCRRYGPPEVFETGEAPRPAPRDDEILVRIHASAVTASDTYIRGFKLPLKVHIPLRLAMGIFRPRKVVQGIVFSGVVESAGPKTQRFSLGDEVYGMTGFHLGCYAEYVCSKDADSPRRGCIAAKPKSLTHEEATAAAYGGLLALGVIERGNPRPGNAVFVYGASGTTGTIAVPYLAQLGTEVTAACSEENRDFVASLGAAKTLNYADEASVNLLEDYDLVLDCVGKHKSSPLREELNRRYGEAILSIDDGSMQLLSPRLDRIRTTVDDGGLRPTVDRVFPLEEIGTAHAYVETLHKRGGVAIRMIDG
ncbi:MAG: NAD(P)-dependent alcohol dehydrogenase [Spirochaeta sp.]|nr:NAD(P)-dependent alcohol dehydrogenase [Spirochaeta sp.]